MQAKHKILFIFWIVYNLGVDLVADCTTVQLLIMGTTGYISLQKSPLLHMFLVHAMYISNLYYPAFLPNKRMVGYFVASAGLFVFCLVLNLSMTTMPILLMYPNNWNWCHISKSPAIINSISLQTWNIQWLHNIFHLCTECDKDLSFFLFSFTLVVVVSGNCWSTGPRIEGRAFALI